MFRSIERDVEYCRIVWKRFPMAEIWYEEFGSGFWGLSYKCSAQGKMGVFGND